MESHTRQRGQRPTQDTSPTWQAHSHLLSHLLEVIKQLQGGAEAFCNEAAALATPAHEPAGSQAVSPRGSLWHPGRPPPSGTQGGHLPASTPHQESLHPCYPLPCTGLCAFGMMGHCRVPCSVPCTGSAPGPETCHLQLSPSGKRPSENETGKRPAIPCCPNSCVPPLSGPSLHH